MNAQNVPLPAACDDTQSVAEKLFSSAAWEEAEIDLGKMKGKFPSRSEAMKADPDALHVKKLLSRDNFLREFFHSRISSIAKTRFILRRLLATREQILRAVDLLPESLAQDELIVRNCITTRDNVVDAPNGIFPQHLINASEAIVTTGFFIPEAENIINNSPADGMDLLREAMMRTSCEHRQARTLDQTAVRHLRLTFFADRYRSILTANAEPAILPLSRDQISKNGQTTILRQA